MAKRDLYNNISVAASVAPAVLTATGTGTGVDARGFQSVTAVINTGAIVAAGLFTPKLQESDDNSAWSDVAAADLLGSFANLAASAVQRVGYKGSKRYVRVVLTYVSGTSIAAGAVVILGHAELAPVA
ncbi:hypothetical protein A4U53_030850 [Rhizobium ruizarguesonis]|uniref:Uncharacterized protein n=2 Tax=Rhizobium TaxID=379 RepID=A0A179BTX1_RHILE|nr:hypothetical protein [Rhizobium leguminosarum]OAP95106.1 hypothetical protein A4U53_17945 [Rhizobium leguminosarum]